jgi:type IV secretory pathway TraG/TraD family ATPase VirD4
MKIDPSKVRFATEEVRKAEPSILDPNAASTDWRSSAAAVVRDWWLTFVVWAALIVGGAAQAEPAKRVQVASGWTAAALIYVLYSRYSDRQRRAQAQAINDGIRGRKMRTAEDAWRHFEAERQPGDPGVLWGKSYVPRKYAYGHFAVVGSVGSGKTLTLRMLMKNQLSYIKPRSDRRALIYDAKQDMMQLVGSMREVTCNVILLNPFDRRGYAWDMAKDVDSPLTARELAGILVPDENESQKFFSNATRELLTKVITHFIKQRPNEWTFRELLLVMRSRELLREVLESDEEGRDTAKNFLDTGATTLGSIMATIATKLGPYEAIAAAWEQAGEKKISIVDWLHSEQIIILGNDERARSTLDAINQLFVALVARHALTMSESSTRMTWLFFDEFREAGRLHGLESLILRGRSKGVCVVLGFQDIQGVQEVYGEKLGNELVGQCGCKAFLYIESPETASWASKCIGDVERFVSSTSISNTGSSETTSQQITARVMPAELQQLPAPDFDKQTGLDGYYIVRSYGLYPAKYSHEQLEQLLGTVDKNILAFDAADASWQYLPGWSDADAEKILGGRSAKPAEPSRSPAPVAKKSPHDLSLLERVTF